MCWCTPSLRTPNCGKIGCAPPKVAAEAVEASTGWRPPLLYDPARDEHRIATQADIDRLTRQVGVAAQICALLRQAMELADQERRRSAEIA